MDNKAHTILSGVIASHGERLAISDAFCKVYLTGYLDEYPQEKKLLLELKFLEIPAALHQFAQGQLAEAALLECIQNTVSKSFEPASELAWGVDAWAAALKVSETMRLNIRSHCFPNESGIINSGQSVVSTQSGSTTEKQLTQAAVSSGKESHLSFGTKLLANVAAVSGIMILQVFGSNSSSDHSVIAFDLQPQPQKLIKVAPVSKPVIAAVKKPVVPVKRIAANSHHPELIKVPSPNILSKQSLKSKFTQPVQIDKPKVASKAAMPITNWVEYQEKSEQLLADTESFLISGH